MLVKLIVSVKVNRSFTTAMQITIGMAAAMLPEMLDKSLIVMAALKK